MEFKSFGKIPSLKNIEMTITQKIHGTNAQIVIQETTVNEPSDYYDAETEKNYTVRAGSRSRWIFVGDDNYGFAAFVEGNKAALVKTLGVGQHFGEWAGLGINSGEGLASKVFVLFEHWKFPVERALPPQTVAVPVLYRGPFDLAKIAEVMEDLKTNGSKLCAGFMRPEGVVIDVLGQRIKKVFEAEETQWTKGDPKAKSIKTERENLALTKYGYLFQPMRMEKLLSRDEKYMREYPASLPQICADYVADLIAEGEIIGDESEVKMVRKVLGGELFKFVKECVSRQVKL